MRHKLYFLLSLFLCGALAISGLYAAGSEEGSQSSSGGGAITNATDVIKIAGAYTVKESWLNPKTAEKYELEDGDWIELKSYYSAELEAQSPHLNREDLDTAGERRVVGTMRVPIVTTEGIHPRVIAMSNSCGHWEYTSVAQARKQPSKASHLVGSDVMKYRDADWERNMWWEDTSDGDPSRWKPNTGNGWNQNKLIPIAPDPVSGQQAFHDTVVTISKVS